MVFYSQKLTSAQSCTGRCCMLIHVVYMKSMLKDVCNNHAKQATVIHKIVKF